MTTFSWKDAPDLMSRLNAAQNHPANDMIDIVTFAGFASSREELGRHVGYYETRAANYIAPKRRRKAA